MAFTTTDIVAAVKKRGLIPTSGKTLSDSDYYRFADEEMRLMVVPKLMTVRENYFVKSEDVSLVASQALYDIPERAIGVKLKNLFYIDQNGDANRMNLFNLDQEISEEMAGSTTGIPHAFYFIDNQVKIFPAPRDSTGSLRMYYYQRRNALVSTAEVGTISTIDTGAQSVVINATPTLFTDTKLYDLIKAKPGFHNLAVDQSVSSVSGTTVTFSNALPSTLAVGDYVALAGESPVIQLPVECHPIVIQRMLIRALRAVNDINGSQLAAEDLKEMEMSMLNLFAERTEDASKKITHWNNIGNYIFSEGEYW